MPQSQPEKIDEKENREVMKRFRQRRVETFLRASSHTIASVILFGGIGYALDMLLGTKPLFLIIGVLIAYPIAIYSVYKKTRTANEKVETENSKN